MKPWEVIKQIESVPGRNDKQAIVLQACQDEDFVKGCYYCYNSFITFGVKQVELWSKTNSVENITGLTWERFEDTLKKLQNREVTGNAARQLLYDIRSISYENQWNNWYRRILLRDLKCGITETTINKCLEQLGKPLIPVFECQLATDGLKHPKKLCGKKYIDYKLNGTRVIAKVTPEGEVTLYSRNGQVYKNFPHIEEQFKRVASQLGEAVCFDGEVMSDDFNKLMTQLRRKYDVNATDATLWLFDQLPWKEFEAGYCSWSQMTRTEGLTKWYEKNSYLIPNINIVEGEIVDLDTEEGQTRFNELNREYLKRNLEGIMTKDPDAGYECKRGFNWFKQKPKPTYDLKCVDVELGEEGKKNANRLGRAKFEGTEDGVFISVWVGGGYSEEQRDNFWEFKNKMIGMIGEIEADGITTNSNGTNSLRFPQFKRFRGFNPGEKL